MRYIKILIIKHLYYLLSIIFLIGTILFGWYIFFCFDLISSNEKLIIAIISYFGLIFVIFQFIVNQINIRSKKYFELRILAYKEIIKLIELITQLINKKLGTNDNFNFHGYVTRLLNLVNEYTLFCKINHDYLFPGISKQKEPQKVRELLYNILEYTDKIRKEIDDLKDEKFVQSFKRIDWHNEVRLKLKDLHEEKYGYYKLLRYYL